MSPSFTSVKVLNQNYKCARQDGENGGSRGTYSTSNQFGVIIVAYGSRFL